MNTQVSALPVIAPEEFHICYGVLKTGMLMRKRKLRIYVTHTSLQSLRLK